MNFFKKHKTKFALSFIVFLSFSAIKCANEASRFGLLPGVELGNGGPLSANDGPQITTLTDVINNSTASDSYVAKEIFIKQTMNKVIEEGLSAIEVPIEELPWNNIYEFFLEIGSIVPPEDDPTRFEPFSEDTGTRVHVYSNKAVNGIRYANAGFMIDTNEQGRNSIGERHLSFEIEKFDGNFQTAIQFLKEGFLGEDAEPCMNTLQDQVYFKKDEWIVEVLKETADSIDIYSPYPPRTMDDVGVVKVSISKGGHYHQLEGSCLPEHPSHRSNLPGVQDEHPHE